MTSPAPKEMTITTAPGLLAALETSGLDPSGYIHGGYLTEAMPGSFEFSGRFLSGELFRVTTGNLKDAHAIATAINRQVRSPEFRHSLRGASHFTLNHLQPVRFVGWGAGEFVTVHLSWGLYGTGPRTSMPLNMRTMLPNPPTGYAQRRKHTIRALCAVSLLPGETVRPPYPTVGRPSFTVEIAHNCLEGPIKHEAIRFLQVKAVRA